MRKVLTIVMIAIAACMVFAPVAQAGDAGAATILSAVLPGTGEWYNSDFEGSYPFAECCVGVICPLVQISSMFDAAAGKADKDVMRIDFWVAPK